MKKIIFFVLCLAGTLSCNQIIDEVEVPPYSVFPNPFTDSFSLFVSDLPNQGFLEVLVTDGSGEAVIETQAASPNTQVIFDMRDKESGVYFIEVNIDGMEFTTSILKAK